MSQENFLYRITYVFKHDVIRTATIQAKSQMSAKKKFWELHNLQHHKIIGVKKFSLVEM